jgi:hypothetical protein
MVQSAVAFIAAPYGFGPTSKAIAISSHLPRSIERVFFGDGPPLELARRSNEFSECIRLDFGSSQEGAARLLSSYKILLFVNTTRFITPSSKTGRTVVLVDTLGWLRASKPSSFSSLSAYFAQRFFNHPFASDIESMDIFHEIGAIVPKAISVTSSNAILAGSIAHKSPIIHCGGLFSPVMCEGADDAFLEHLLQTLAKVKLPVRIILPKNLHERYLDRLPDDISLIDCSPLTVQEHIEGSSFSLTTSGIEFTYESMLLGVPTIFLPPFNASQYLQLEHHRAAHGDWIPFHPGEAKSQFDFTSLDDATAEVQRIGAQKLWRVQFGQIGQFLQVTLQKNPFYRLDRIRRDQECAIQRVGSKGAHIVASYALRELQSECLLQ